MIIAIDFDGTIVDHAFPDIGKINPGAIEYLKLFQENNARLILYTMRSGKSLEDAVSYLKTNGIDNWYGINENSDQYSWTSSSKVYANIYIDDAAYGCPLIIHEGFYRPAVDWTIVGPDVLKLI